MLSTRLSAPALVGLFAILALLGAGLLWALTWAEADREAELQALEADKSTAYLEDLRVRKGLTAYLKAVRTERGFDTWNSHAPLFLIGRWALEPTRTDAWEHRREAHCLNGLVFEDGRVRRFGTESGERTAQYRIAKDGHIEVRENSTLLRLVPAVVGTSVDHLTVRRGSETLYATRCG